MLVVVDMVGVGNIKVKTRVYHLKMTMMHGLQNLPVNIKLTQGEFLGCICVGSFINWSNPFVDVSEYNFNPSVVLISLDLQEEDLALKSPVNTDRDSLRLFMSLNRCWKCDINESRSSSFWLGER